MAEETCEGRWRDGPSAPAESLSVRGERDRSAKLSQPARQPAAACGRTECVLVREHDVRCRGRVHEDTAHVVACRE